MSRFGRGLRFGDSREASRSRWVLGETMEKRRRELEEAAKKAAEKPPKVEKPAPPPGGDR